jgi:transcriptional regulator with XRE-family HTH domain
MVHVTTTNAPASALAFGIASVLSDEKRARGLSGQQIADLTGITQAQISRFLNARVDISVQDLVAMCDGLGLDFRDFLAKSRDRAATYDGPVKGV